jgi:hypothetical protein
VALAAELNRPNAALDGVGIGLDTTILEEQGEPLSVPQRMAAGQSRGPPYAERFAFLESPDPKSINELQSLIPSFPRKSA